MSKTFATGMQINRKTNKATAQMQGKAECRLIAGGSYALFLFSSIFNTSHVTLLPLCIILTGSKRTKVGNAWVLSLSPKNWAWV